MTLPVKFVHLVSFTSFFIIFFSFPILAQESLPDKTEIEVPENSETKIQAIPLEAVPDRAARTVIELGALLPTEDSRQTLNRIDTKLDFVLPEVEFLLSEIRVAMKNKSNIRILQELKSKNRRILEEHIQPWIQDLDTQLSRTQAALQQTDRIIAIWAETSAEINRQDSVAETTVARVAAVRSDIDKTRSEIVEHRNRTLSVRDRLVNPSSSLEASFQQLQNANGVRIKSILGASRPPLWSPQIRESLKREWVALEPGQFFRKLQKDTVEQASLLNFQLLIFVVLTFILYWLRLRVRTTKAESNYDLSSAKEVFEVPLAMALLITASFTTPLQWLGTNSISFIVVVLCSVAILSIIRRFLTPAVAPLVWGLMIIAIFDRIALDVLESSPTLEYLVFLIEMVGAMGFSFWYLKSQRQAKALSTEPLAPFLSFLNIFMRLALAVLGVAILADLIGWANLSRMLRAAVLGGGYASIGVYVLFLVFQSLVTFALLFRPLSLLRMVSRNRKFIRQQAERILKIIAVILWVVFVFRPIGVLEPLKDNISGILSASASVGTISVSLGDILVFILITWFSLLLARFVNFVLREDVFTRVRAGRGVPQAIASLVRYSLILLGFFIALAAAGIELTKLSIIAGGLGVGIGFGLQNVVNNFVSGLILLFERPIGVGDVVELPDIWGEIKRIGMRASVIRKFDGSEVIVPNSMLISDKVLNWTLSDRLRRIEINIGVEYGTPAKQVIDLLVKVANSNPKVLTNPAPDAYFLNFGDSALEFILRAWVDFDNGYLIKSELATAVQEAIKKAGINVPFPQRDLHLVSMNKNEISDLDAGSLLSPHPTPGPGTDK